MINISAKLHLRPIRIGFLVRPNDRNSIRKIMRLSSCLWGGLYNPIIPAIKRMPIDWREAKLLKQMSGEEIVKGYIDFFEPDVYVEAEKGLLHEVGLSSIKNDSIMDKNVILLDDFFNKEFRGKIEPFFGQTIFDVIENIYDTERKFKLKDALPAYYSKKNNDILAEIFMGVYPDINELKYVKDIYDDVYQPDNIKFTPELLLEVLDKKCITPFSVTSNFFDIDFDNFHEPKIYIFNPNKITDIIDLWNIRIEHPLVYPIPMDWISKLSTNIVDFIKRNFQPIKGNSSGMMHSVTIEISRSISKKYAEDNLLYHFKNLPQRAVNYKYFRTLIWKVNYENIMINQPKKLKLIAEEKDIMLSVDDIDTLYSEFQVLSPHFSQRYSFSTKRWANILTIFHLNNNNNIATYLPHNTYDINWPFRNFSKVKINKEGWVYPQEHKNSKQSVSFLRNDDAFFEWFKNKGLNVYLSEAGQIAKQILDNINGIWGLYLIDDENSINFINNMSKGLGHSTKIAQWQEMINKRKKNGAHSRVDLDSYVERNIIKLGLETDCLYCYTKNWHGLDEVSYKVKCARCLKEYNFPQAKIKPGNNNWKYRLIGPFATQNFAQGAYTSLLTIRFFTWFWNRDTPSNYTTASNIKYKGKNYEIDFAIWISNKRGHNINLEPKLIIGEAKSFGINAIQKKDLEHLKETAKLLPDSFLVISVLKETFSEDEKKLLKEFVEWSRKESSKGKKYWVILLTATELFNEFLTSTWKNKGEPYSNHTNYHDVSTLESLSDSTLSIYLDEKKYYEWKSEKT